MAVILFLLNDYYEYGIYTNSEDIVEVNGEGEILWGKTIDESFALIEDNRPYYMELYTGKTVDDDMDYFALELSEESLQDFGDRDYILERIFKELNVQFNTRRQILLKTLFAYILQDRRMLEENDGISMFGTTAYHAVWEKVCAEVFDNKLHTTLGQLKMSAPLAEQYHSMKKKTLIEIIEKPIWEGLDTTETASDTLIPNLISTPKFDGVDYLMRSIITSNLKKGNHSVEIWELEM